MQIHFLSFYAKVPLICVCRFPRWNEWNIFFVYTYFICINGFQSKHLIPVEILYCDYFIIHQHQFKWKQTTILLRPHRQSLYFILWCAHWILSGNLPIKQNNFFFIFQCNVAAAMVASASVSYSSVNQYDGNRSIMWRHLNTCSTCDKTSSANSANTGNSSTTVGTSIRQNNRNCRHTHHYHHNRRPAIRQNKRCTFATATTTIPVSSTIGCNQALSVTGIGRRHHHQQIDRTNNTDSPDCNENPHQQCQSQSSNSSNTSSIRIID